MGYSKKVLILSETTKGFGTGAVKGVAAIEQFGQRARCSINIFNLKDISKGLFAFGVASDNSPVYTQRLGQKGKINATMTLGEIDLRGNLYCVLCYISDENIIPIAWGANNAKKLWETNILDGFKSIIRPAMFAGKLEKVEIKKENLGILPQATQTRDYPNAPNAQITQTRDYPSEPKAQSDIVAHKSEPKPSFVQQYRTQSSYQRPTKPLTDSFFDKPLSIPKIMVAKISKVIDEAERDYDDSKISKTAYYPQDIKARDIMEESAAAAQAVQEAARHSGFYEAFEKIPNELIDSYQDQRQDYSQTNYNQSHIQRQSEYIEQEQVSQPKQEQEYSQDDLFQVYYPQDNHEDLSDKDNDFKPRYISSWGGYNNIRLKDQDEQDQNIDQDQDNKSEQAEPKDDEPKYFLSVKDQLDKLFENSPPEEKLNNLMPDTYWVKVEIGQNQYYVVGLIGEGPDYIGYGVPGAYSVNPPKELQGYCKWLALDKDNPQGEGYWMMYQDADNGQSINLDLI